MDDRPDLDQQIGELLHRELPVPEHREGHRERVAALLTAEAVERAGRKRWLPELHWPASRTAEEPAPMRRVAPRPARSRRLAVVAAVALVLVIAGVIGSVEALQRLGTPTMVLRITDETVVDTNDPAGTRTTIVATAFASLDETKALLRDLIAAINAGETEAVRKFYLTNGWLDNESDQTNLQGSVGIANYWREAHDKLGIQIRLEGDPIPYDRYIVQRVTYVLPNESAERTGIHTYQINADGQIAHEWILGWVDE